MINKLIVAALGVALGAGSVGAVSAKTAVPTAPIHRATAHTTSTKAVAKTMGKTVAKPKISVKATGVSGKKVVGARHHRKWIATSFRKLAPKAHLTHVVKHASKRPILARKHMGHRFAASHSLKRVIHKHV